MFILLNKFEIYIFYIAKNINKTIIKEIRLFENPFLYLFSTINSKINN